MINLDFKKILKFYVTISFVWGIILLVSNIYSEEEFVSIFRDSLWQKQLFVPIFILVFIVPYLKWRKEAINEKKLIENHEQLINFRIKTIGTAVIFMTQAIIFVIGIAIVMTQQLGTEPTFQAYETWKGFVFVMGYFALPFNLAWLHHGKEI